MMQLEMLLFHLQNFHLGSYETTCQWEAPVAYPDDGKVYEWDEDTVSWKEKIITDK